MAGEDGGGDRSGRSGGGEEPEERTDGWMATYADMVTLLMTFFVLMFAISNVDAQKVALMFAGLSRDGLSVEKFESIMHDFGPGGEVTGEMPVIGAWWQEEETDPNEPDPGDPGDLGNPELDELYRHMNNYIGELGLGDVISLNYDGDLLLVTLSSDILFRSGSADIQPAMREVGEILAHLLAETQNDDKPFEIIVSGHTDNVPMYTTQFPSNWWLSVGRAVNFMELLISESGLAMDFFSARGFGETQPVADNNTDVGKQANRRVTVHITMLRAEEVKMSTARLGEVEVDYEPTSVVVPVP